MPFVDFTVNHSLTVTIRDEPFHDRASDLSEQEPGSLSGYGALGLVMLGDTITTYTGSGASSVALAVKTSPIRVSRTVSHAANATDCGLVQIGGLLGGVLTEALAVIDQPAVIVAEAATTGGFSHIRWLSSRTSWEEGCRPYGCGSSFLFAAPT